MDALELINTIECDLKDADKKIGKKTYGNIVNIGGRWTGAWIGAKLGAEGGAAFGTYIYPGIGTLIGGAGGSLILGCVGAFGGGEFAKWVVDVSNVEGENYVIKKMDK
ncbi:MAG: hypothetical protein LKJ75_04070 [Clostridia bacterium]|jgi:outer membrane lipoprotein SlyB|nr:hypothetical protein [Clostridia bacterium]MCI2014360.1 hypothetical protein [Clostridia bacterium]